MKETNTALEEIKRKESFFRANATNKKAMKSLNVLQRFRSKLNEFNLTSQGEHKGFALEKSAENYGL